MFRWIALPVRLWGFLIFPWIHDLLSPNLRKYSKVFECKKVSLFNRPCWHWPSSKKFVRQIEVCISLYYNRKLYDTFKNVIEQTSMCGSSALPLSIRCRAERLHLVTDPPRCTLKVGAWLQGDADSPSVWQYETGELLGPLERQLTQSTHDAWRGCATFWVVDGLPFVMNEWKSYEILNFELRWFFF